MAQLYLQFAGIADLEGAVDRPNYEKQISVNDFSFNASHFGGRPTVKNKGATVQGNAEPSSISLSKVAGQESTGLIQHCLAGTVFDAVTITMDGSSDDKKVEPIVVITLELVAIANVSWSANSYGGEDSINENVTLEYNKVAIRHVGSSKEMEYTVSKSAA